MQSGVLGRISDIVHHLFVALQEQFLPYYQQMNQHFAALVQPGRAWRDRQWGTCIYDDVSVALHFCFCHLCVALALILYKSNTVVKR